jgi:hypothetical protein
MSKEKEHRYFTPISKTEPVPHTGDGKTSRKGILGLFGKVNLNDKPKGKGK